jgi:MATE family multidrug resistance protein
MAMGVADTMMLGRVGAESIGAASIGRAVFLVTAIFGFGILFSLDTVVSNAFGAGNRRACRAALLHGVYLAVMLTPILMIVVGLAVRGLANWGLDPAVLERTVPYVETVNWSMLPLLLYATFRRYLQAINLVRPVMIALVSANLINVAGNWAWIFGHLGFPAMGARGAAWSTCLASGYMAAFLLIAILLQHRREVPLTRRVPLRPDPALFRRLLSLGVPVAFQLVLEVGVFALATALAGRLTPATLAAHQIAINAASVTYMVPLGISSACAVRVGQALGRGDVEGSARAGWTSLFLGASFMLLAAVVFVSAPRLVLRAFTTEGDVIAAGVRLLHVAALFQLFDGLQVVATGALRGAGDTRTPMLWNLLGYWLLGLPVGYFLCFRAGWGAVGLWLGLSLGLIVVGSVLVRAWARRVRTPPAHAPST